MVVLPEDIELRRQLYRCADALARRWPARLRDTVPMLLELLRLVDDDKEAVEAVADALCSGAPLRLAWGRPSGGIYPLLLDGAVVGRFRADDRTWASPVDPAVYAALMAHMHEPSRDLCVVLGPPC